MRVRLVGSHSVFINCTNHGPDGRGQCYLSANSTRKPSCFRRRCWWSAADSNATVNFSTSSASKQAISSQEFTPHSWNICISSASTSAPGKPNNQMNEASMVMGAARSFIGVILVDSESEWDAPTADNCFEGEDMTINE